MENRIEFERIGSNTFLLEAPGGLDLLPVDLTVAVVAPFLEGLTTNTFEYS